MIEALKSDDIVRKVGGRFKLTALIQRRLKEIMEGSRPLVDTDDKTLIEVVIQEIASDKIGIDYDKTDDLLPVQGADGHVHKDTVQD